MLCGDILDALNGRLLRSKRGKVQLVFTSPPFPLNRKKRYGNMQGAEYVTWLASLAPKLAELLAPNGSIVMEVGNAWVSGQPVMSLLPLQALMGFVEAGKLHVCQQFVCFNPARLPSPAEWVTVQRIRVKDAYTNVWWMAGTTKPKADNRRVLTDYSPAMKRLLAKQSYNAGKRPSQFNIREKSFLTDNAGAIPPNVLTIANTGSRDRYSQHCRTHGLRQHPARMPPALAEFFIRYLTDPGDLVLDPFAGSNTTGSVAQQLGRKWIGCRSPVAS